MNINVNLNINDTCCGPCFKNSIEKNETITSTDTAIELQDCFFLNVLGCTSTTCSIIIQNGNCVIIRKILLGVATSILIPSKCSHIVTITFNT